MTDKPVQIQKQHFLVIEDHKGRQEIPLTEASYSLGRSSNCNIRLRSQFVSRYHATLLRCLKENGESYYQIMDGDDQGHLSSNGLLINGRKLPSCDLKHGDEIVFGPQVSAIYQYRQRDKFPTQPSNDPFDITLIDPAMMINDEDVTEI
jgi:pSer/pThr/pTyr-binding forkhead associated (FHA) protein